MFFWIALVHTGMNYSSWTSSVSRCTLSVSDTDTVLQKRLQDAIQTIAALRSELEKVSQPATRDVAMLKLPTVLPESDVPKSEVLAGQHPVCQGLGSTTIPSAISLWMQHIRRIHSSSRLVPMDAKFDYHDLTSRVLHVVSSRLPLSTLTLPEASWSSDFPQLLDRLYSRYQYLKSVAVSSDSPSSAPPPIQILVMGGSVAWGQGCREVCVPRLPRVKMTLQECAFPYRLEQFMNRFALSLITGRMDDDSNAHETGYNATLKLFEVTKVTLGGTNTAVGTTILKYGLVPRKALNADIILNAYSTNDMHVLSEGKGRANETLLNNIIEMGQEFVRTVWSDGADSKSFSIPSGECQPRQHRRPLLLFMDDFLGKSQRNILELSTMSQALITLGSYYGFGSFSFTNSARRMVFADTYETWFSPSGWWKRNLKSKPFCRIDESRKGMLSQTHPGMGAHLSMMWVIAYNLLHITTSFCSLQPWYFHARQQEGSTTWESKLIDSRDKFDISPIAQKIALSNANNPVLGQPRPIQNHVLPPPLTQTLLLDSITQDWKTRELGVMQLQNATIACPDSNNGKPARHKPPCVFSWVGGLSHEQNDLDWVLQRFRNHLVNSTDTNGAMEAMAKAGWGLSNDGNKLGWVPLTGSNDSMVLRFSLTYPIRTIALFHLKSYGEKWDNSTAEIEVQVNRRRRHVVSLKGYHDKQTTETYTYKHELTPSVPAGATLQITIRLFAGSTFKLTGLAICR
jgi:hypothetical protein